MSTQTLTEITTQDQLMALPIGTMIQATWTPDSKHYGTGEPYYGIRSGSEHSGASSSRFSIMPEVQWRQLLTWDATLTVISIPALPIEVSQQP